MPKQRNYCFDRNFKQIKDLSFNNPQSHLLIFLEANVTYYNHNKLYLLLGKIQTFLPISLPIDAFSWLSLFNKLHKEK